MLQIIVVSQTGHFGLRRFQAFVDEHERHRSVTEERPLTKRPETSAPIIETSARAGGATLEIAGVAPGKSNQSDNAQGNESDQPDPRIEVKSEKDWNSHEQCDQAAGFGTGPGQA